MACWIDRQELNGAVLLLHDIDFAKLVVDLPLQHHHLNQKSTGIPTTIERCTGVFALGGDGSVPSSAPHPKVELCRKQPPIDLDFHCKK